MRINCHVPVTLRLTGVLTDDQLAAVGRAVTRAVAARLAEAERLLVARHGAHAGLPAEVRERYDPDRSGAAGYDVPSYGKKGDPVTVSEQKPADAGPKPARRAKPIPAKLRKAAKTSPEAADQLWQRYRQMTEKELRRRARKGDETAKAVLDQTVPPNDEDLAEARSGNRRPPHLAFGSVKRNGVEVLTAEEKVLHSGNQTEEERALGPWRGGLASHTEARLMAWEGLRRGDLVTLMGTYNPCSECRAAMQRTANERGVTVRYYWIGGGVEFTPGTEPRSLELPQVRDTVLRQGLRRLADLDALRAEFADTTEVLRSKGAPAACWSRWPAPRRRWPGSTPSWAPPCSPGPRWPSPSPRWMPA